MDIEHNNPLGLSPREEARLWSDFLKAEDAGKATLQGPNIAQIVEDLAVEYLTTEDTVRAVILDRSVSRPC